MGARRCSSTGEALGKQIFATYDKRELSAPSGKMLNSRALSLHAVTAVMHQKAVGQLRKETPQVPEVFIEVSSESAAKPLVENWISIWLQ